jgi:hypothetical protein
MVVFNVTSKQEGAELMPHEFCAVTQTLPLLLPAVAMMEVVPCPLFIVQPVGTVHVYDVAPVTALIE